MIANKITKKTLSANNKLKQSKKVPVKPKSNKVSEIYFKAIFENAGIGIILMDLKRKILNTNLAIQRLLKYSDEELSGITLKRITHPDDYAVDEKLLKEVTTGKRSEYTIEKRYLTKDGDVVYCRTTLSSTYDLKLRNKSIIAIVENITRQKQFENKFVSEKGYLDSLLENSPDQIYFKDLNSRFLKASTNLAKKHNMTVDDLIGRTDFDVFGVNHASDAYNDEQEIIRTGIPIVGKEEREEWADGRVAWVSTSKMPFYDSSGKLIGTFGISRDITLKKRTEQSREALFQISETAFTSPDMQSLFRKIHDVVGMLMPAKNLYIALYNEQDNLLSFPYFIDEYDKTPEPFKPNKGITEFVLKTGKATLFDDKRLKELIKSGELRVSGTIPKIWLGVPLKLSGNIIGIIAVQDYKNRGCYGESELQLFIFIAEQIAQAIERKRNSEEIARYAEELKQLNATKDKFFSIIAHDLKNPFITILGFTDLLSSDYFELSDDERLDFINEMKKTAEISFNLLQNLLQWSRSQTGRIEFNPKELELLKIVDENLQLLNVTAERKQIQLYNEVISDLRVIADEEMLNTVFRNLITNAIKFSSKGGNITVSASVKENQAEICVSDTGIGMEQKTISNLFKLEVTQSTTGTENETGTGLGLILCKEFIERNNGKIRVESEVGKGSKFIFTLPVLI
ncbi:MAG: PAS domain S-box protein [Ignavibacteriaceae bacterium]|nr:PAS domain S-box protein [Ignavibacteriaceae bacterium]